MEKIVIRGGHRLCGSVNISGAKNAAVAILAGAILSDGVCRISNLPLISDTIAILRVLQDLGAKITYPEEHTVEIDPKGIHSHIVPISMTKSMRASTYFIGALLGRFNKACVAPPGGCDFGVRPIDQHLKGFQALGSTVAIDNGMVDVKAQTLTGNSIYLDMVSVGATINIMLAAVKAKGLTIISNAAREPHVVDLANFLNSMGADIMGAGTSIIKIRGVDSLSGTDYMIIPDQIEAGTYMVAAAATRGDITISNITPKHLESISAKLKELGAEIYEDTESLRIVMNDRPKGCSIKTMPHPGFPTDMQPQIVTLLSVAQGLSVVTESVWDNRFKYVDQLALMGAQIKVDGKMAVITGVDALRPAPVQAIDLRAGAAMVIAGLMTDGVTEIENIDTIKRGYEKIAEKFTALGADICYQEIEPIEINKNIG